MKTIEGGVKIELILSGETLGMGTDLPDDGYAGELTEEDDCVLCVTTGRGDVCGFSVDGQKNVGIRRNVASELGLLPGATAYEQRVTVKWSDLERVWCTGYPQNNLRLLEFKSGLRFTVWEIALISQDGKFFVTVQTTYEDISCYRDEKGRLACPEFDKKWPQLVNLLSDILLGVELPPLSEHQPKAEPAPAALAQNTAKVLWWNSAQGFGMAAVDKSVSPNGIANIHRSELAPRTENGLAYLETGELVRYEKTRAPYQTMARGTKFVCELVGVTLPFQSRKV